MSDKKTFLLDHLLRSQADLETVLADVDESLWSYKPNPESWTIGQCSEHIVMVETAVSNRVGTFAERPPEPFEILDSDRKDQIVLRAADRTGRVQAPPSMMPTNRYQSPAALLTDFRYIHSQLVKLAEDFPEWLRGRFTEHMVFKKLDGYQWILVSSCHTIRHTAQILEIKKSKST